MSAYGKELRRLREREGKSLRELSRELDISPTYVSDVERGFRSPFEDDVTVRIIDFLEIDDGVKLYALAAEDRIRNALTQNFPKLSDDAIGRMVKLALKDLAATA